MHMQQAVFKKNAEKKSFSFGFYTEVCPPHLNKEPQIAADIL